MFPARLEFVSEMSMNKIYLKMLIKMHTLMSNEQGQDLVEYALIIALLSVGTVGATRVVAAAIVAQFTSIAGAIS